MTARPTLDRGPVRKLVVHRQATLDRIANAQ
jgi:hypothetical protein